MKTVAQFVKEEIKYLTKDEVIEVYKFYNRENMAPNKKYNKMLFIEKVSKDFTSLQIYNALSYKAFGVGVDRVCSFLKVSRYRVEQLIKEKVLKVDYTIDNPHFKKSPGMRMLNYKLVYKYYKKLNEENF